MFNNAIAFRLIETLDMSEANQALAEYPSREPGALMSKHCGFVAPDKDQPDQLARKIKGAYFIRLKTHEKIMPASVINAYVEKKVAELELKRDKPVGRTERIIIKESVIVDLLPKALIKSVNTDCFIDPENNLIVVNAPSFSKAEDMLSMLRKAFGSLPVMPIVLNNDVSTVMTTWADSPGSIIDSLEAAGKYAFHDSDNTDKKAKFNQFESSELDSLLTAGFKVSSMSFSWEGGLDFVLDDDFRIKSIKDISIKEEDYGGDEASAYESDALITHDLTTRLFDDLITAFGGEA